MSSTSQAATLGQVALAPSRLAPATLVFAIGAMLMLIVGFAQPELIHNAAHDTRHAIGYPCH